MSKKILITICVLLSIVVIWLLADRFYFAKKDNQIDLSDKQLNKQEIEKQLEALDNAFNAVKQSGTDLKQAQSALMVYQQEVKKIINYRDNLTKKSVELDNILIEKFFTHQDFFIKAYSQLPEAGKKFALMAVRELQTILEKLIDKSDQENLQKLEATKKLLLQTGGGSGDGQPEDIAQPDEEIITPPLNEKYTSASNIHFGADILFYGSGMGNSAIAYNKIFKDIKLEASRFDVFWGRIEKSKGVYDWTLTDDLIKSADSSQAIIFTLYSTSEWGVKYNDCRESILKSMGNPLDMSRIYNRPPSSTPNQMSEYLNFIEQMVNRYKDKVKYWQIENEVYGAGMKQQNKETCPHNNYWIGNKEEYLDLLKQSYTKIKQLDKNLTVFSAGLAFGGEKFDLAKMDFSFADYIFDQGRDYMDMIDIHLYGCVEDVPAKVNVVKDRLKKFGYTKPFWSTETGEVDIRCHDNPLFTKSFDSPEELKLQSEEIVKKNVLAFASGIDVVLRLKLGYYGPNQPTGEWYHMSLTFDVQGNERKPGYYTYQIMVDKLKNFTAVTAVSENIYKFEFVDKKPVLVAWTTSGSKNIDLSPYVSSSQVVVTSLVTELQNGEPVYEKDIVVDAGKVMVSGTPVFIEEK